MTFDVFPSKPVAKPTRRTADDSIMVKHGVPRERAKGHNLCILWFLKFSRADCLPRQRSLATLEVASGLESEVLVTKLLNNPLKSH